MSPSRFAVRRPIFTWMILAMVVLLGGISLTRLPIDLMPDITYPTLSVQASYENAGPEEVEELVTRPIEEAVSAIPGVEEVTSTSAEGSTRVRISFQWGTNLDAAANDIRDRIDRIISRLPEEAERPQLRKFDLASFPILFLGVASDMDPLQLRRAIDTQVKYRIERVPGVAAVDVRGGIEREIQIELDPEKVQALSIPLETILSRLRAENVNVPAGTILQGGKDLLVRTPGEYKSMEEIRSTVVAIREGAPVRLGTLATVTDGWKKLTRTVRVGGKPGMRLAINKQAGTNTVEVSKAVLAEVERINRDFPQLRLSTLVDTSSYIERAIDNVGRTILVGGLLAIVVLLVFLGSLRSTLIIAASIPISGIATFTLMYFSGYTLNLMSLGGLALGVGMLVDNSIVVLESIYRYVEQGLSPKDAAIRGGEEVTTAIVASTLTTLAVFLPLVFVEGMTGIMMGQLAAVVSFSLLCSLGAALTLVPMLSAALLQSKVNRGERRKKSRNWLTQAIDAGLRGLEADYAELLGACLRRRLFTVFACLGILGASLLLIPSIGAEMMPSSDEGEVRVNIELEVGTTLREVDQRFRKVEEIVHAEVPERSADFAMVGGPSWRPGESNTAEMRVSLVPASQRTRSSEEIAQDLRKKLEGLPGMKIRTRAGQGLFILRLGSGGGERLEIEVRGHDLEVAEALGKRVQAEIEKVPGVTDVRVDQVGGNPEEQIVVDRQKAAALGLSVREVASMLETTISGNRVGVFRDRGEEAPILVRVADSENLGVRRILDLTVVNSQGQPVVLRNVVRTQERTGPSQIQRKGQARVLGIQGNFAERSQSEIIADIRAALETIPVPEDFSILISGDHEEQVKAFRELLQLMVLALLLVYMVMACQYESLRHPFVVMFSVPLSAIGVVLALYLTDTTFNFQSFIGCIMLGGIVVNNAILLVDQINLMRRREGLELEAAIREAGRLRLRPILMTAATTILGLIPMALGWGEGGETQAPLARAVVGGMLSSTAITLVFVPVVYSFFAGEEGVEEPLP